MFMGVGHVGRQMLGAKVGGAIVNASPTLDLTFVDGSNTLDPRITFTRASTATYFDSSGVMQTAVTNAPRFDYDPVTHVLNGLLIEEVRTNVALQSGDFTNVAWNKGSVTLSAGTPGPNGVTTGSGFISANAAVGTITQSMTPTAATPITLTCYAKAAGQPSIMLLMPVPWFTDASNRNATYNLSNGTVSGVSGATASATITPAGNGWYRIGLTATPNNAAAGSVQFARAAANGDGVTVQSYVWGAQLEQGAFPTSYVPTTAATVTRSADLCSMPWANTPAFSVMLEGLGQPPVLTVPLVLDDGTGGVFIRIYSDASGNAHWNVIGGSDDVAGSIGLSSIYKIVGRYVPSTQGSAVNGILGPTSAGPASTPAFTILRLGSWFDGTLHNTSYVRRVRYWPRALSNAELQSVTT